MVFRPWASPAPDATVRLLFHCRSPCIPHRSTRSCSHGRQWLCAVGPPAPAPWPGPGISRHPGGLTPLASPLAPTLRPTQAGRHLTPRTSVSTGCLGSLLPLMRQLLLSSPSSLRCGSCPSPSSLRCGSCSSPSSLRCSSVQLFRHPHPHAMPPTSCHVASGLPADAPCLDVLLRTCPFLILLRFTLNVNGAFLP